MPARKDALILSKDLNEPYKQKLLQWDNRYLNSFFSPAILALTITKSSTAARLRQRHNPHPQYNLCRDTHWTVCPAAFVFLETAYPHRWEQSCSYYMTQTPDTLWTVDCGLGLVLFCSTKVQPPPSPTIHESLPGPWPKPHFSEAASDEFPLLAIKGVQISKTILQRPTEKQ